MKFVISVQKLNYLLNKCMGVISPKPTLPILSNILVEAVNDELVLTASDLTLALRCFTADVKISQEGGTTLSAKKFGALIRELTAAYVEVSTGNNDITSITAADSTFKLRGMSRREFPEFPDLGEALTLRMPQKELKSIFYQTAFAAARDDDKPILMGILLRVADGKITLTGTDGKRLAKAYTPVSLDPSVSGSFVFPIKAVDEMVKNLSDEGDVVLHLTRDRVAIETEDSMMLTKLVAGDFPEVGRVIPMNCETVVSLHREELMTILRQIALFTTETVHSVKFAFDRGELKLSANSKEVGEAYVGMPVNYEGQPLEVAFNPNFFLEALKHIRGDYVSLGLIDSFNPGILTSQENHKPSVESNPLYMLMPMRICD